MKKTLLAIALVCAALAAVSAQEQRSGLPGDQAITDYTEAIRLNPGNAGMYLRRGRGMIFICNKRLAKEEQVNYG